MTGFEMLALAAVTFTVSAVGAFVNMMHGDPLGLMKAYVRFGLLPASMIKG